jgi:hypothetical protein
MKILFTGVDGGGAWTMRGEQIAATRAEWKAVPHATRHDAQGMDAVVIVKKIMDPSLAEMKAWGGPLVYDALDFWRQRRHLWQTTPPLRNLDDARAMIWPVMARIDPDLVLCPTARMASDLEPLGWPTRLHYHHFDPRLEPVQLEGRRKKRVIYHGRAGHLGIWRSFARLSCFLHGAEFVTSNGPQPEHGDVLLAVRRGRPWVSRRWKSNIKAAVAMKLGLPFVAWPEAGYLETHPAAFWFKNPLQMHRAIGRALRSGPTKPDDSFSVERCADRLETVLEELLARGVHSSPYRGAKARRDENRRRVR